MRPFPIFQTFKSNSRFSVCVLFFRANLPSDWLFLERASGLAENCLRGWDFWIKLAGFTGFSILQKPLQMGW